MKGREMRDLKSRFTRQRSIFNLPCYLPTLLRRLDMLGLSLRAAARTSSLNTRPVVSGRIPLSAFPTSRARSTPIILSRYKSSSPPPRFDHSEPPKSSSHTTTSRELYPTSRVCKLTSRKAKSCMVDTDKMVPYTDRFRGFGLACCEVQAGSGRRSNGRFAERRSCCEE